MDKTVKIGIIGTGNMGTVHLGFFHAGNIPNAVVTAVADTDEIKLEKVRKLFPGKYTCYRSGEELIEKADVDAVIIATPHYNHPALAIAAFAKGLHVLSEKPSGVYTKQVREMNKAAQESGKIFCVMFNQRKHFLHKKIKELISGEEIGRVKRVNWIITNWFRTQHYYDSGQWRATWAGEGGGVLINQAIHQIDLLQWFTGMPQKVFAFCGYGKWHDVEVEDAVTAFLLYKNGATGVFVTTTGESNGTNRLEIFGSRGNLLLEGGVLTLKKYAQDENEFIKTCPNSFSQPEIAETQVFRQTDSFYCHKDILCNFVAAIRGEEPLFVDGKEGINSVSLMNAMLLSSWLHKDVDLPIDEDLYFEELSKRIAESRAGQKKNVIGEIEDNTCSFGGF